MGGNVLGVYLLVAYSFRACLAQVIRSRVDTQPMYMWNRPPGHLQIHSELEAYPFDYPEATMSPLSMEKPSLTTSTTLQKFTAVITITRPALRESSPVIKLVQALARSRHLECVLLLWAGVGTPQVVIVDSASTVVL